MESQYVAFAFAIFDYYQTEVISLYGSSTRICRM